MPIPFLIVMLLYAEPTMNTLLIGGAVAMLGELLRFWGVAYAGSLTRVTGSVGAPELVVAGPFAFVRNPLYVGNILLYVGVAVMSSALWPWLTIATGAYFFYQYMMIVSLEEEFLHSHFGALYTNYQSSVPKFVPRLRPFSHPSQERQRPEWRSAVKSEARTLQAIALVIVALIVLWQRA